jgi:hypothetical protein
MVDSWMPALLTLRFYRKPPALLRLCLPCSVPDCPLTTAASAVSFWPVSSSTPAAAGPPGQPAHPPLPVHPQCTRRRRTVCTQCSQQHLTPRLTNSSSSSRGQGRCSWQQHPQGHRPGQQQQQQAPQPPPWRLLPQPSPPPPWRLQQQWRQQQCPLLLWPQWGGLQWWWWWWVWIWRRLW